MLDDIRASVKWPEVFEGEQYVNDKKTFDELAAKLRQETAGGEVSAKSLREARDFVRTFGDKLRAQPLKDPDDQKEAQRFLTGCTSVLGLLEKPNIGPALLELRKVKDTTIGALLGFMHVYNLKFGVAKTPQEKQAYNQLHAILDQNVRPDSGRSQAGSLGCDPSRLEGRDRLFRQHESGTFAEWGHRTTAEAQSPAMSDFGLRCRQ